MIYPATDAAPRTDVRFDELADENHHVGKSPLHGLGIGFVSQFCLDYMHLICLGVTRKLLTFWMRGPLNTRLPVGLLNKISQRLIDLRHAVPSEFATRPQTLLEVDRWKATEYRSFFIIYRASGFKGIVASLCTITLCCCLTNYKHAVEQLLSRLRLILYILVHQ